MVQEREEGVPEEEPIVDFEPEEELGSVAAAQVKLKKLKEELEQVKKERQEYLDGWQRCKADSINARKDVLQAAERAVARAQEDIIESIIPVVDSFDMAMAEDSWSHVEETWRKGVESIRNQLVRALELHGATQFGNAGESYDPYIHEALEEIETEGVSGVILTVVRRGWKVRNRIVRPAHVRLIK